jgi:hypothetical protein
MPGLTTSQVAHMLGISQDGARKMMGKLEAGHRVPISNVDGRWQVLPHRLRGAYGLESRLCLWERLHADKMPMAEGLTASCPSPKER